MNAQTTTDATPRSVAGLFIALIAAELVLLAFWWYASYYWTLPVWAIIGYAVLGLLTAGLFVLVVSKSKRKVLGVLITTLLVVVVAVAFMLASMAFPGEWRPARDRVAQMGEEAGFTVLVPETPTLPARSRDGMHPSSDLTDEGVVTIEYEDFDLSEQASDSAKTAAELEAYIDLLQPEAGSGVTLDVSDPQALEVLGQPAIFVFWRENVGSKGPQGTGTILICQPEGMVARIASLPLSDMTPEVVAALAETMKPVK